MKMEGKRVFLKSQEIVPAGGRVVVKAMTFYPLALASRSGPGELALFLFTPSQNIAWQLRIAIVP